MPTLLGRRVHAQPAARDKLSVSRERSCILEKGTGMWIYILKLICVYLGWFGAIASIVCGLGVRNIKRMAKWVARIPLSSWTFTTIVLAMGTYTLVLSQQLSGLVEHEAGVPVIDAIVRTIRCFSASDEITLKEEMVRAYFAPGIDRLYLLTNSLAHLAAPVDTLMGIFLLVTKFFSAPLLRIRAAKRDTYVFSRLNTRSMSMAQSIRSHYKDTSGPLDTDDCLIAFAKTAELENDPLYTEAITSGMICLDQSSEAVLRFLRDSSSRRTYIFSEESELKNLQEGTRFVRTYVELAENRNWQVTGTPEVYMLSSTPVAENFVDAATHEAIVPASGRDMPLVSVRRADWVRNTTETLLWKMPIFLTEHPSDKLSEDQERSLYRLDRRRVVIVGGGTIGYEFLKASLWCCQLGDIRFTFDVIDLKAKALRERMAYDAPEIIRLNGDAEGAEYQINFIDMDASMGSYLDHLRAHRDDITYVLVSLGNDLTNVNVARRTREVLEQGRYGSHGTLRSERPLVAAVVADDELAKSVAVMATGNGIPYEIVTVGSYERIYSFENVFRFELDRIGRNINRAYWGCYSTGMSESDRASTRAAADASYERLEYNRRSSRASAIHLKYDLYAFVRRQTILGEIAGVPTSVWLQDFYEEQDGKPTELAQVVGLYERSVYNAIEGEEATDAAGLEWISRIEHDRWDAYMRTEGYEMADRAAFEAFHPLTGENQNRLAKQHVCLVPFDLLDEVSGFVYPITGKGRDRDYKMADDMIVRHLPDIVWDFE